MLEGFVWFENSEVAVNMSLVKTFSITTKDGKPALLFRHAVTYDKGMYIQDRDDIANFLKNVAKLDTLPKSLNVTQVVDTVEKGASFVDVSIGSIG